jgi:hypothetical protein
MKLKKGGMGTCLACDVSNTKQNNMKKASYVDKSVVPGGPVYLDIYTVKSKKGEPKVTKPNWSNELHLD